MGDSLIKAADFTVSGEPDRTLLPYTKCVYFSTRSIVDLKIEAIVNAANSQLRAGSGVCGVIFENSDHKALQRECSSKAPCPTGGCVLTNSYSKSGNYKYIIHAVGPMGEKPDLLEKVYTSILDCCLENNIKEVAIPCISTGIYGYPEKKASIVALQATKTWLEKHPDKMEKIVFVLFTRESIEYYRRNTSKVFAQE